MTRLALLLACALLGSGAAEAATWNTLSGAAPKIIAHRGVPADLPENSLPGYARAMALGADLLETDVHLTVDGVVVLMHDATLTRTTNVETVFPNRASYAVSDFTAADIATLKLKTVDGTGTTDAGVPTLDAFLDLVNDYNAANGTEIGVLVEVKGPTTPALVETTVERMIAKGFDAPQKGQVQAFDTGNVDLLSAADLDAAAADLFVAQLAVEDAPFPTGDTLIISDVVFDANGQPIPTDSDLLPVLAGETDALAMFQPLLLNSDLIAEAHGLGLEVYGWTFRFSDLADARAQMRPFLDAGLDGFITDQTALARAALTPAPIPLPAALPMLGGAIGLLALIRRRG